MCLRVIMVKHAVLTLVLLLCQHCWAVWWKKRFLCHHCCAVWWNNVFPISVHVPLNIHCNIFISFWKRYHRLLRWKVMKFEMQFQIENIAESMDWCKIDITPLLTHWSYVSFVFQIENIAELIDWYKRNITQLLTHRAPIQYKDDILPI